MGNVQTHAVENYSFHWIIKKFLTLWLVTGAISPKNIPIQLFDMNKIKILSHATSNGNKLKQVEERKTFVIYNIVSIVWSPSKKSDLKKFMKLRIYLNVVCKVLGWFLSCTWIRWFIRRCFQRVIWWRWGREIRQTSVIFLCRMYTFLFLCVFHCGFTACWYSGTCFSLFIQASISACLFCSSVSSCDFLICSSYIQASSWRWRSLSFPWVFLIASLWRNPPFNPSLASIFMQKSAEACGCLFL